jgi:hypothetical protein
MRRQRDVVETDDSNVLGHVEPGGRDGTDCTECNNVGSAKDRVELTALFDEGSHGFVRCISGHVRGDDAIGRGSAGCSSEGILIALVPQLDLGHRGIPQKHDSAAAAANQMLDDDSCSTHIGVPSARPTQPSDGS